MKGTIIALTVALTATVGNAVTFDPPLDYAVYDGNLGEDDCCCQGNLVNRGTINSLTVLDEGVFCETSFSEEEDLFTRTVYSSADSSTLSTREISVSAYRCSDNICQDCNLDQPLSDLRMEPPEFETLPAADSCWFVRPTAADISLKERLWNQFAASADPEGVATYWQIYIENSILNTLEITEPTEDSSSAVENDPSEDTPPPTLEITEPTEDSSSAVENDPSEDTPPPVNTGNPSKFLESLADFLTAVLTKPGQ